MGVGIETHRPCFCEVCGTIRKERGCGSFDEGGLCKCAEEFEKKGDSRLGTGEMGEMDRARFTGHDNARNTKCQYNL